jgi:hypothetical protein
MHIARARFFPAVLTSIVCLASATTRASGQSEGRLCDEEAEPRRPLVTLCAVAPPRLRRSVRAALALFRLSR